MIETYWAKDGTKARIITYIIYPDSAKENFIQILKEQNIKCALSPLHNLDIKNNGELEKPHYHLVVKFEGPISWDIANEISISINAYNHFQKVRNISDIINYLTHDSYTSEGKQKYDKEDINFINCTIYYFSNIEYIELLTIIEDREITNFWSLVKYLHEERKNDLLSYVIKNTYFFNTYINSRISQKWE